MWQQILYPPIFTRLIDASLTFLFNWTGKNISPHQKLAAYPHLYSFTSTKSVVHWFQIIRTKSFQMYDDDVQAPLSIGAPERYYKVAKFPTRNIKTPIVLLYGGSDSLVDIKVMKRELPRHTVAKEIPHFEHLDFLWAQDVQNLVFPHVFSALEQYSGRDHVATQKLFHNRLSNRVHGSLSQFSDDEFSSIATDDAGDSPTMGQRLLPETAYYTEATAVSLDGSSDQTASSSLAQTLRSNTKSRRQGTNAVSKAQEGKAGAATFKKGGIAVGASKAIVGGPSMVETARGTPSPTPRE